MLTYRPDRSRFPIRGIDVSHHQREIDWERVAGDDVTFAYIKGSEGGDYRDPNFEKNRANAERAGIRTGAYHFFTFCRPGADQAENFLAAIGEQGSDLPPAVDLEFLGNCDKRPSREDFTRELGVFLATTESRVMRPALLYAGDEFLDVYGIGLPRQRMWRRALRTPPEDSDWTLWQYQNAGWVASLATPVDLDLFNGSAEEFRAFANETAAIP